MTADGLLALAGPTLDHTVAADCRGITVLFRGADDDLEAIKAVVEADPAVKAGRLRSEYLTWYVPKGAVIHLPPIS